MASGQAERRIRSIHNSSDWGQRGPGLPGVIDGIKVEPSGEPLEVNGERYQTLLPVDESDLRIWEYSYTTGRLLRTQ